MPTDLTPLVNAINQLTAAQAKDPWDYAYIVAAFVTLFVVGYYTWETYKLRRTAQDQTTVSNNLLTVAHLQHVQASNLLEQAELQNEIPVMPMFGVYVDREQGKAGIKLKNVGKGPAFNVSIDPVVVGERTITFFNAPILMTPESEADLGVRLSEGATAINISLSDLYYRMNIGELPEPLEISLRCKSITAKGYQYVFRCLPHEGDLVIKYHRQVNVWPNNLVSPEPVKELLAGVSKD